MLMKNVTEFTLKIPSDLVDDWGESEGARPERATIPPGAVVSIRDEYALRSVPEHAVRDPDTNEILVSSIVPSRASSLSGGMLQPHGEDAEQLFASKFHSDLPNIRREMAELQRKAKAERAERWLTREQMEIEIGDQVKAALAKVEQERDLPITPHATPRFHADE